jgi:hypothetical protein
MIDEDLDELVLAARKKRAATRESIIPNADRYIEQLMDSVPKEPEPKSLFEKGQRAKWAEVRSLPVHRSRT